MNDDATPEEPVDEYWHFRWTAFVIACLVCLALFGGLVLARHVAPVETAASLGDYLVLACGFFLSLVGVKGETWNASGTTWLRRLTWAGRMILLGLLFTLSVTLYQKLEIDAARKAEDARKDEDEQKGRKHRMKQLQAQLDSTKRQLEEALARSAKETAGTLTGAIQNTEKTFKESATKSEATLQKIEQGIQGCPADVQSKLRPELAALAGGITRGGEASTKMLEQLKSIEGQVGALTRAQNELEATKAALKDCMAQQKMSDRLLLRKWEGHWAHGNWFTEARFERTDDQRLSFSATTTFEAIARKGSAKQSVELMRWQGDPFACDGTSDRVAFPVKRSILPSAQAVDENLKEQSLPSTMRMRLALALVGDYGGNGEKARLVMYEALD